MREPSTIVITVFTEGKLPLTALNAQDQRKSHGRHVPAVVDRRLFASRLFSSCATATLLALALALLLPPPVCAYIPAVSVNGTSALNTSDDSIHLAFPAGISNMRISRQLWQGGTSEQDSTEALSQYNKGVLDDIFTICRDLGAQAALLDSLYSEALDVFATTSAASARLLESEFDNVHSNAYAYDSASLNASASVIQTLLDSNALSVSGTSEDTSSGTAISTSSTATAGATTNYLGAVMCPATLKVGGFALSSGTSTSKAAGQTEASASSTEPASKTSGQGNSNSQSAAAGIVLSPSSSSADNAKCNCLR
ncbi:hypothetical protein JCM10207_008691 [Rhodosporidiobolus poonsookiae]